jgi:hypothetical protein
MRGVAVPLYRKTGRGRDYLPEGGLVAETAQYSLLIQRWDVAKAEFVMAWHVWEPGAGNHGKMHGTPDEFALFADFDWVRLAA